MDWHEVRGWFAPYFQVSEEPHVWAVQLALLALATMLCNSALQRALDFFERLTSKTSMAWDTALFHAARLPLRLLVWLMALSLAGRALELVESPGIVAVLNSLRQLAVIGIAALFISRLIREMEKAVVNPPKDRKGAIAVDAGTAGAVSKALQLLVLLLASLVALEALGLSVSGVLAFGGIGGMAPNRRSDIAKMGIKAMIAGSIAAFMTATIAGALI